jgi:hypothetical protein
MVGGLRRDRNPPASLLRFGVLLRPHVVDQVRITASRACGSRFGSSLLAGSQLARLRLGRCFLFPGGCGFLHGNLSRPCLFSPVFQTAHVFLMLTIGPDAFDIFQSVYDKAPTFTARRADGYSSAAPAAQEAADEYPPALRAALVQFFARALTSPPTDPDKNRSSSAVRPCGIPSGSSRESVSRARCPGSELADHPAASGGA